MAEALLIASWYHPVSVGFCVRRMAEVVPPSGCCVFCFGSSRYIIKK